MLNLPCLVEAHIWVSAREQSFLAGDALGRQCSIQLARNNFSGFPGCTKFSRCSKASPKTSRQNFSRGLNKKGFTACSLPSLQALLVSYLQFLSFLSPGPKYRVPPGGSRPARTESKAYNEWYTTCGGALCQKYTALDRVQ